VEFVLGLSSEALLEDLTVNGVTVAGFAPNKFSYDVALAPGTIALPAVGASGRLGASVVIDDVDTLPGTATITVTSADTSNTNTYVVNFTVDPAPRLGSIAFVSRTANSLTFRVRDVGGNAFDYAAWGVSNVFIEQSLAAFGSGTENNHSRRASAVTPVWAYDGTDTTVTISYTDLQIYRTQNEPHAGNVTIPSILFSLSGAGSTQTTLTVRFDYVSGGKDTWRNTTIGNVN
jgi:hypothetical protein